MPKQNAAERVGWKHHPNIPKDAEKGISCNSRHPRELSALGFLATQGHVTLSQTLCFSISHHTTRAMRTKSVAYNTNST